MSRLRNSSFDRRTIPKKKNGPASKRPDANELIYMYQQYTSEELGARYGVSPATVRSWVSRLRKELDRNE